VKRSDKIIEIGPGYNPLVSRVAGWNCYSLDHATQEELQDKYRGEANVDIAKIEPIDFIWKQGVIESAVPAEHLGTFDACIASHVLEHVPDFVGFFKSVSRFLKAEGILSLAIPDKRFCFDYFQSLSTTPDMLNAQRNSRHTKKTICSSAAFSVTSAGARAWSQHPVGHLAFIDPDLAHAKRAFDQHEEDQNASYVDSHCWYFTPGSFELVLLELGSLGLIDFKIERVFPTSGCEFYVALRQDKPPVLSSSQLSERRLSLLQQIVLELRDQANLLVR
jgi:SAM-dependent methyltransferase